MKTMQSTSTNKITVAQRKRVWVLTHRSKRSSRIAPIGREHLKVKLASPLVKLAESKLNQSVTPQVLPWLEPTLALKAVITCGRDLREHIRTLEVLC
jgi:hypothetical protein